LNIVDFNNLKNPKNKWLKSIRKRIKRVANALNLLQNWRQTQQGPRKVESFSHEAVCQAVASKATDLLAQIKPKG